MTRTQGLLVVLTCVLALAWLSSGGRVAAGRAPAAPPAQLTTTDPAIAGIVEQTARIRAHLSTVPPLAPSRRNLFQFRAMAAPAPSTARRRGPALSTGVALTERPARPDMQLVGIAEDQDGPLRVRTAVVSAMSQLFVVREGERVLERYEIVKITADAAQLKDPDGRLFTIALR